MNKKISILIIMISFLVLPPMISAYGTMDGCRAPTSSEVSSVGLSDLYYQGTTDQEADQICEALWSGAYSYGWSGCASSSSFDSTVFDESSCAQGETWYPAVCCQTSTKPFSTLEQGSSTARCEGSYVSACTPSVSGYSICSSFTKTWNNCDQGCEADAPSFCKIYTICIDDYYAGQTGNCGPCRDEDGCTMDADNYDNSDICPLSDCKANTQEQYCDATFSSCSGLDKTSCQAKTETDQDGNYESGCQWVESSSCAASQTKEVTCSGTYQETVTSYSCEGSYTECLGSSSPSNLYNFFALITGNLIAQEDCPPEEMSEPLYCYGSNQIFCEQLNPACIWTQGTSQVTRQCSSLDETTCENTQGCTKTISCTDCTDTDGGVDIYTKGTSTYGGGSMTDSCLDSDTVIEHGCDLSQGWQYYDCPNGCVDGACVDKKPNCEVCTSGTECQSGLCSPVLGPSGRRCVDSGYCPTDTSTSCQVPAGGTMCQGIYIGTCNNGLWSTQECIGTCDGTTCTADPILSWRNGAKDQLLSSKVFSFNDNTVSLVVENPKQNSAQVTIKESDSGEGALNTDETIKTINLIDDSGKISNQWSIKESDLLLSADDSDDIFEFYFEYEGIKSSILTVTKDPLISTCSNGVQDGNETEVDCGGDCPTTCPPATCVDAKQNQDETDVDCGGVCGCPSPSCDEKLGCIPSKALFWVDANNNVIDKKIVLNSANLSGNVFKMIIQNPSASPGDFDLKEYDGPLINDNLDSFTGQASGNGYEYTWITKYSNFWDAASSDTDGIYEFYFTVDGETSPQMQIEVIGTMPTCTDGIQNGAETGINYETGEGCGGECPACPINPCLGNTVCTDYTTESECRVDDCNVAEASVPVLGANEKASCYWDDSKQSPCNAQIISVDPSGKEIGGCNYVEDFNEDTCEDGFLSYSYTAEWIWAKNNNYTSDKSEDVNYVLGLDGRYHYDPERSSLKCESGSRTVQCPAQVQLSFFDWRNLVAVGILIIIIYFIIEYRKNKKLPKIKREIENPKKKVRKKSSKKK